MWPEGRMALRSFMEMPIARERPESEILSSSPTVLTSSRRGEAPPSPAPAPPRIFTASSETLVTDLPVSRSNQSLPTMPLIDGVAPLRNVLWPIAVTVGKCW